MRSPTLLEAQLLNEVLDMHKEEKANKYIFKDEKGNIYLTPHPTPNSPKDTAHGAFSFSPDELNIIANFEVSGPRKDDLFPESYPPIEEFLRFSVSEMIKILISEGKDSPKFQKLRKEEPEVQIIQTPIISWDPNKGREIETLSERRVYSTKSRIVYILKD